MSSSRRQALRPVRGVKDLLPEESHKHCHIQKVALDCARRFGFRPLETPIFEYAEVFHSHLGEDSDIVNKETYTFEDRGGDAITLRPEGTAGLVRAVLSQGLLRKPPLKFYYEGPMFRYERPQKGRLRQFHQLGIEFFGNASVGADLEVLSFAWIFLKELQLRDVCFLYINNLGSLACRKSYVKTLVQYLEGHKKHLSQESQERLQRNPLRILDSKASGDKELLQGAPSIKDHLSEESLRTFESLKKGLESLDIPYKEEPHLVRGLDYYNQGVFEFKTLSDPSLDATTSKVAGTSSSLGSQDTVLAGGRYDHLVESMGGPSTPAVGWAAGLERIVLLMEGQNTFPPLSSFTDLVLLPMGKNWESFALQVAHKLRQEGFHLEIISSGNLGKRWKKAELLEAKWIWIMEGEHHTFKNRKTQFQWKSPSLKGLHEIDFQGGLEARLFQCIQKIKVKA